MPQPAPILLTTDEVRSLARAAMLVDQYSLRMTGLVDRVLAVGSSGNHEVQVLTYLFDEPGRRPPELVRRTGLSRAGVAALVARLEQMGLVERTHGHLDRRTMHVSLTRTGRRRLAKLDEALEDLFVTSAPLAREAVELLAPASTPERRASDSALVLAGRLSATGAAYVRQLDAVHAGGLRQRLALTTMTAVGPVRPTPLAAILGLSSGGLTYLVDQLEAAGLAERAYGVMPEDRRAVVVRLTDAGVEAGRALSSVLVHHADAIATAMASTLLPRPA